MPESPVDLVCPACRAALPKSGSVLACEAGHQYEATNGIPRLIVTAWKDDQTAVVGQTATRFGEQWTNFADSASVNRRDLLLHLPSSWSPSVFRGQVLDVGCGMGRYAALVAAEGANVVGVDVSSAVDAGAARYPNVPFVQADLAALPFAPRRFDLVYSFGVMHHLPDPSVGLKSAFEMVRPGGWLLVWVYSEHAGLLRRGRLAGRKLVQSLPALRRPLAALAAGFVWLFYVIPFRLTGRSPRTHSFFSDKGYRQLFVDSYDALSAPLEVYLTEADCRRWIDLLEEDEAGFERRRDGSGWLLFVRRSPTNRFTTLTRAGAS